MITGVMIALFIVLIALRVPVCFAIGSAIPLNVLPRLMISTVDSFARPSACWLRSCRSSSRF